MPDILPSGAIPTDVGTKNNPTSLTPVGPYNYGTGGLFSSPGQDPSIFSAIIGPVNGLLDVLPVLNGEPDLNGNFGGYDNEFFSIITGVTQGALETFANQPTTKCADGARAGIMNVCTLVSPFGRYRFSPNGPVNIFDAGRVGSRAEPLTLKLMNSPMSSNMFGVPTLNQVSITNTILNELSSRMFAMGLSIARFMGHRIFIGSPTNNNGEARDILGLDTWISAGNKRDAYTSNLCNAADPDIKNFGYSNVASNTRDIQQYAEMVIAYLDWNTSHQGLGQRWDGVIVMRPEAWEVISQTISVRQYQEAINQAGLFARNVQVNISAEASLAERNKMRDDLVWPLRGRNIKVVLDDSIAESTPNQTTSLLPGSYASDIYFVNTTVLGGIKTTYLKTYNHDNANSEALARLAGPSQTFTSDNGQFRWYINHKNGCIDWTIDFSPRLVVRCPQLCARIQNVAYSPLQHFRSGDPSSDYFANGGRTNSPISNYYVQWQSTPSNLS